MSGNEQVDGLRWPSVPARVALAFVCAALLSSSAVAAKSGAEVDGKNHDATTLDTVEVQASRLTGVSAFDTPASISVVDLEEGRVRSRSSVAEALDGIPGVLARERQNFAQDTQLSMRGFGARSTFGVRSLRLYVDGIPATMPDGQGQLSHVNWLAADRVEILRGPFSALHGNSPGGVMQIWSADAAQHGADARVQASLAPDATRVLGARARGAMGRAGYHLALSSFDTDGWREHSAARRDSANLKLQLPLGIGGTLALVGNYLDAPDALDPLGLNWQQVQDDPRQATAVAKEYRTRKSTRQSQLGAVFDHALGEEHHLHALVYGGDRDVEQYLALPIVAQNNPLNSGGVIDLGNAYGGADLRWSWLAMLAGRPFELTAGVNADRQRQHRRGYENHRDGQLGVRGVLRRDERNRVANVDQYLQGWWQLMPRWSLLAGVRHSAIGFRSEDHYVTADNPDDSGRADYSQTAPVAGVMFSVSDDWRIYLSAGRGFETPTFNELAYRADGQAGLALDLSPARSRNVELGSKWQGIGGASLEMALFRADTHDELAVARNVAGRSSYRNVGTARRQGFELASRVPMSRDWEWEVSYTWLDARFPACGDPACHVADARIPGVPRQQLGTRLSWRGAAWQAGVQLLAVGDVTVDDAGSALAPGYALLNAEVARDWWRESGRWRAFLRLDNALDKAHVGSVIVNEGNGRYFEPGPDRGALLGLRWDWRE